MENRNLFLAVGIIILAVLLGNQLGLFSIFGPQYIYEQNTTFLGYEATVYSTENFSNNDFVPFPACGGYSSGSGEQYNAGTTFGPNIFNTYASCSDTRSGCNNCQDKYSPNSIIETNNLNLNFSKIDSISFSYNYKSTMSCGSNSLSASGSATIKLNDITIITMPSASNLGPQYDIQAIIEIKPYQGNLIVTQNLNPYKVLSYDPSKLYQLRIYSNSKTDCNSWGGSSLVNLAINDFKIASKQDCKTSADTDCNGQVSRTELGNAITKWTTGTITRSELGQAIMAWAG